MNTTLKTLVSLIAIILLTAGCNIEEDFSSTDEVVEVVEDPIVDEPTAPAWDTHGFERCTVLMGGHHAWLLYDKLLREGHENGLSYIGNSFYDTQVYGVINWFHFWDNDLFKNPVGCDFGATVDIIFMVESNDLDRGPYFKSDIISGVANFPDISKYLENVYLLPVPLVPGVVCAPPTWDPDTGFTKPTLDPNGLNYPAFAKAIEELDGWKMPVAAGAYITLRKGPELHYETCEQMEAGPFWIQEQFLLKYGTEY